MADPDPLAKPAPVTPQPFLYAPAIGERARSLAGGSTPPPTNGDQPVSDSPSADQIAQKAYEKGVSDGSAAARAGFEKAAAEMRSQISAVIRNFSKDRAQYFDRIEAEVVRLSLSIARKILHRESQMDPMVLTGVVHVALKKLDADSRVRLRTHPDEACFWSDYVRKTEEVYPTVEVVGDPSFAPAHCTLETEFGSTEVSLESQLKEIEQGFFDLLEQRPKGAV
jgi:flagellar assembly protein FliH